MIIRFDAKCGKNYIIYYLINRTLFNRYFYVWDNFCEVIQTHNITLRSGLVLY